MGGRNPSNMCRHFTFPREPTVANRLCPKKAAIASAPTEPGRNEIGAMFSSHRFQNLALCKKKISRHIKLAVHAWSTKC